MRIGIAWVIAFLWVGEAMAATQERPIVQVEPAEVTVVPGDKTEVPIAITVAPGFHVQANPAAEEFLIPLTVELEDREGLEAGEPRYPPSEKYRLQGSDEDLLVYGGTFTVLVPVEVDETFSEQDLELEGELGYQACDDRSCRAPATTSFPVSVRAKPNSPE